MKLPQLRQGRLVAGLYTSHELHIWANTLSIFWAMLEDAGRNSSSCSSCIEFCLCWCWAGAIGEGIHSLAHAVTKYTQAKDMGLDLAPGLKLNHGRIVLRRNGGLQSREARLEFRKSRQTLELCKRGLVAGLNTGH